MFDKTIRQLQAREILDSRGNPTVEVELLVSDGSLVKAAVPSGASTGSHEAAELRDGDQERYQGLGVSRAVAHVNEQINDCLKGRVIKNLDKLDELLINLDATSNKGNLGANAIVGVSLAVYRAGALVNKLPLYSYIAQIFSHTSVHQVKPVPMMNILNGGRHADNSLNIQEFMVVPRRIVKGVYSIKESVRAGAEIFHNLGKLLQQAGWSVNVGNEGGYAPEVNSVEQVLQFLTQSIKQSGYDNQSVGLAIDAAASEFYKAGSYNLQGKNLNAVQLVEFYKGLIEQFDLMSVEDGLAEDDWSGWQLMTEQLGQRVRLVGDDLFVTNLERLNQGIKLKVANTILVKPNQIGTVTETLRTIKQAQSAGYGVIVSHRSGETLDDFIVDLAVGVQADFLKAGAPSRGERVAKYNRLMAIEEQLNKI